MNDTVDPNCFTWVEIGIWYAILSYVVNFLFLRFGERFSPGFDKEMNGSDSDFAVFWAFSPITVLIAAIILIAHSPIWERLGKFIRNRV